MTMCRLMLMGGGCVGVDVNMMVSMNSNMGRGFIVNAYVCTMVDTDVDRDVYGVASVM